jgi:hypothetical protein
MIRDEPCGWPACWPREATWTGCAPAPMPAMGTPRWAADSALVVTLIPFT